jgi:succinate dehydrogenase / fumarate reductase membrane anchor subunit
VSLRSPLGRVLGSGSAREGTHHFWGQRVSAAALVLLGLWFLYAVLNLPGGEQAQVLDWIMRPWNSIGL